MTIVEQTPNGIAIEPNMKRKTFLVRIGTYIIVGESAWLAKETEPTDMEEQLTLLETLNTLERDEQREVTSYSLLGSMLVTRLT